MSRDWMIRGPEGCADQDALDDSTHRRRRQESPTRVQRPNIDYTGLPSTPLNPYHYTNRATSAIIHWTRRIGGGRTMVSETEPSDGSYEGDPIGPGFFHTLRQKSGTKKGRHALILAVGVVAVGVIIAIGLVLVSSISRQSQSYKDGYSVGGAVYAADGSAQLGAQAACKKTELRGPHHGGLPVGANARQWLHGCTEAFESAQGGN
jgi:hypothetical protein